MASTTNVNLFSLHIYKNIVINEYNNIKSRPDKFKNGTHQKLYLGPSAGRHPGHHPSPR